jgi:uncharacterized DUF497 family protein
MEFEWDRGNAADSLRKHKVSFTEAATVPAIFSGLQPPTPTTLATNTDTSPSGYQIAIDS